MRNATLDYHEGWLVAREEYDDWLEPFRITYLWPLQQTPRSYVEHLIGQEVRSNSASYAYSFTWGGRDHIFRLPDGGQTKALSMTKAPVPCPKVRAGIETRWRGGYWQKYLKAKGWVAA